MMQSTKCYHGLTILFNPKALRLRVDLGMLKVSLAFAKSMCPLFTEEIVERMALLHHDYQFVFIIYVSAHHFPRRKRKIVAETIT